MQLQSPREESIGRKPLAKASRSASERRAAVAERTQQLLFEAKELDAAMTAMPVWVHARLVSAAWRREMLTHLQPIHHQMASCQQKVIRDRELLQHPFDESNLAAFERRLEFFERSVTLLASAIEDCKRKLLNAEALAACRYIQIWTRKQLAKRGFYTKVLKLTAHHRGLVPGMFDSIAGNSKLTLHRSTQHATLEYPRSDSFWDSLSS
ncbi:hypothetical protein BBJ28_00017459 [Nothophytophthora sp. Chile5]|nr:hypothetical protein BBJ28_00017459 [Nothophytophthora sp. Chile5]